MSNKKNLVSGMRPTGQLHLGHYMGVLRNWVSLQNSQEYECFFFIADWHSLTTSYSQTSNLKDNIIEVAKDFLASGIDPERSCIYVQSAIPEIAELHILLSMLTPHNWVERDPTLKDLVKAASNNNISELSYGMLGYPVLQTADILAFRGEVVPVGKDQEAHLEMSREIARRFNHIYDTDILPECKALFTETPSIRGVDNQKMSKSYNNDIKLAADQDITFSQVKKMITDPQRQKVSDPGDTSNCQVVYPYYEIFADQGILSDVKEQCHSAQRGCFPCKKQLAEILNAYLEPLRERRSQIQDGEVKDILHHNNQKARSIAKQYMEEIRDIMSLY